MAYIYINYSLYNSDIQDPFYTLDTLYNLVGGALAINSLGFLFYFLLDVRREDGQGVAHLEGAKSRRLSVQKEEPNIIGKTRQLANFDRMLIVSLMTAFNFFFAGLEGTFKNLLPTFANSCELQLSRQQGATLQSVFFGTFTLNRSLH